MILDRPLNPVDIEQHILELTNRISRGIQVYTKRYAEFLAADRDYDRAFAQAYFSAEGSVEDRKKSAELKTYQERERRDVAEVAHKQADKLHKALSDELRAFQSIGASVRQAYAVAGRGEGA